MRDKGLSDYKIYEDDIEQTNLQGEFNGVIAVLLFEHIDWQTGIDTMVNFDPGYLFFIIQGQANTKESVVTKIKLEPSIQKFASVAEPHIIDQVKLEGYLKIKSYYLAKQYKKPVADGKVMTGLVFTRN